jgi:hypothetical protein
MKYEELMRKKKVKGERVKKEKYQNRYERRARGLIRDFEIAVRDDPHAWYVYISIYVYLHTYVNNTFA